MLNTLLTSLLGAAVGGVVSVLTALLTAGKKYARRQKAEEDGLRCLLRAKIIDAYEKGRDNGFCPLYQKESLKRMYAAYHTLGGNDIATNLYLEVLQMPTQIEKDYEEEAYE